MGWRDEARAEYVKDREAKAVERAAARAELRALEARISTLDAEIANLDTGAKAFGLVDRSGLKPVATPEAAKAASSAHPQYKDIVLRVLQEAYPHSLKAAQVQQVAQAFLGREVHWKTTGMTLYRLKKDGLARRVKQDWFYLPEAIGEEA